MKSLRFPLLAVVAGLTWGVAACAETVTIHVDQPLHEISPLIYGSNHEVEGFVFTDARRLGGNRLTAYNWEIDASNAGRDYRHQNDRWLSRQAWWEPTADVPADAEPGLPAASVIRFHTESRARGAYSLVTVPMAGYVAGDADGPVGDDETAPSPRWVEASASDADDGQVSAAGLVGFLVNRFGGAGDSAGIRGYSLDDEPALWFKTHPRLHPRQVTVDELLDRSVETALAVRQADPDAEVYGPALWGMTAYDSLSNASDWPALKQSRGYDWFIDAYLDHMKTHSERHQVKLLDVLDVHWYTEDPTGRETTGDDAANAARALYDPTYTDPSWIGKHRGRFLPLLPKIRASIDRYYPGTKLAISEYDWPLTGEVHGGLAQADALGVFGAHGVYFAAYHHKVGKKPDRYVGGAFNLYRNYDGEGGRFGVTALPVDPAPTPDLSVYAALDGSRQRVHVIVVDRGGDAPTPITLRLAGGGLPLAAEAWMFDGQDPAVRRGDRPAVLDRSVMLEAPPLSAVHLIIGTAGF